MSWQRILEVARRRGMPVIVTDLAGREPMVVLPLEEYERVAERYNDPVEGAPRPARKTTENVLPSSAQKPQFIPVDEINAAIEEAVNSVPQTFIEQQNLNEKSEEGLSLEERFYLEPLDEEG